MIATCAHSSVHNWSHIADGIFMSSLSSTIEDLPAIF